jgi:gluconokinase
MAPYTTVDLGRFQVCLRWPPAANRPLVVVMGVSGSGKSTIGTLLADALGVAFIDGDALHPASNVAKMAAGMPLIDDDRWPWLAKVGQTLAEAGSTGLVMACSALKRVYRDAILREAPTLVFLYLAGSREVLASRIDGRSNHFMPLSLLDSQLLILESLQPDEPGVLMDIDSPVSEIVANAVAQLRSS